MAKSKAIPAEELEGRYTNRMLTAHGYTTEAIDTIIEPMGATGKEALGSMGNDAPLACLSQKPRLLYEYFKQLFAQGERLPETSPAKEPYCLEMRPTHMLALS